MKQAGCEVTRRIRTAFAIAAFMAATVVAGSLVSPLHAEDEAAPAIDAKVSAKPGAAGEGKGSQIFHARCIACHNKQRGDNSPFGPPNLYIAFKTKAVTPTQAQEIITHGKGQIMPSFAKVLSKSDIQNVIAYLQAGK